ncbi:RNA-directed DNA polymerase from mobile element jockey [Operophtera brumata]|uniref:RNA-directed DNA polymerase from mobile element jockey n=1 Tax=Operophtera brumata TaxID=104452 RepID=A0A0L7KSM0_OPEBR|nr:RNA-directed DNA polymerase from mobile element jockey [Operophtera brumata]
MYSNPFPTYQAPTRPPIPNYITPNQSVSYRKTLQTPPRPRALSGKSYDREAHQAIVGNIPSSLPNGCALMNDQSPSEVSQEDGLLDLLLTLIINIIKRENSIIPSNVAQKLMSAIALSSNNNGSNRNSASLRPKKSDLIHLISKFSPSVIAISETWLVPGSRFRVSGYSCLRDDRADGYAGCALLIRRSLPFS